MTNRTNVRDFAQKKSYSVSAATLQAEEFDGLNAIEVFNLPEKALVTNAFIVTEVAGPLLLTLKVDVGATSVILAGNADTTGGISEAGTNVLTGTGQAVTVTPSAAVLHGTFTVIIEYIEYTLGNGHLTNYSDN